MTKPTSTPRAASYAMLALVPALLLAACGGNGGSATSARSSSATQAAPDSPAADSVHVDAAIEKNPCELAPAEMVAGLFGVPAADLQRESSMSSACVYSWENDDGTERLDAKVKVADVGEDAERAASNFRSVTRGMSGADVDQAMAGIKEQVASEGGLDSAGKRKAADVVADGAGGSGGIRFEDVDGVGDEARLALTVGAGELHVRVGNLYFIGSAYRGPGMQMPDKVTGASIMAADKQWRRDTMPQRKDAAIKLARAVVQSL